MDLFINEVRDYLKSGGQVKANVSILNPDEYIKELNKNKFHKNVAWKINFNFSDDSSKDILKIIYDGRHCAVSTYTFACIDGIWCVLANKRGKGTPDYQGCWNSICGFLEGNESGEQGASREVYEETTLYIDPKKYKFAAVQTEPELCNNGNVSLRYIAVLNPIDDDTFIDTEYLNQTGGEKNEVDSCKWIPIKDLKKYNWAFDHAESIPWAFKKIPLWKRLLYPIISKVAYVSLN